MNKELSKELFTFREQPEYRPEVRLHQNEPHLVVPVVMMIEGVHNGSHGPLLHLGEDLGKFPEAWNGIPVVVFHPERDGVGVSANYPDIVDDEVIGRVYNTYFESGKLRGEAWISEPRANVVSSEVLNYIRGGRPLDVSVGVFTEEEPTEGEWRGEDYVAIARNHRPDHLALLPGAEGACSWADGCGVRVNRKGGEHVAKKKKAQTYQVRSRARMPSFDGTSSGSWSAPSFSECVSGYWKHHPDATRTENEVNTVDEAPQAMRNWIASLSLLGSGEADTFEELLYFPVVNPDTMELNENALRAVIGGRGAQADIPDEAKASARRRAYQLLNSEFNAELDIPENLQARKKLWIELNQDFTDIAREIQGKLDAVDTGGKMHYLEALYEDTFIYFVEDRESRRTTYYQQGYTVEDNGVQFTDSPVQVEKRVEYVTQNMKGGKEMKEKDTPCCPEKVEALIKNSAFDEADRDWLNTLSAEQLEKIEGKKMSKDEAVSVLKEHISDSDKFLELLPEQYREQMRHRLRLHEEHRASLISRITTNTDVYTEEDLGGKDTPELEKLVKAVKPVADYSAFGGVGTYAPREEKMLPPGVVTE